MNVTYDQVLAWRLRQQGLAPRTSEQEGFADLAPQLTSGWSAVLKPLAWSSRHH
jgi:hypothetical protein